MELTDNHTESHPQEIKGFLKMKNRHFIWTQNNHNKSQINNNRRIIFQHIEQNSIRNKGVENHTTSQQ